MDIITDIMMIRMDIIMEIMLLGLLLYLLAGALICIVRPNSKLLVTLDLNDLENIIAKNTIAKVMSVVFFPCSAFIYFFIKIDKWINKINKM